MFSRQTILRALALLVCIGAANANAKVGPTTLTNLFQISDRVVVGRVVKIEKLAGFTWARVAVTQNIKGTGAGEILFLAEPTWTCDTSSATVGLEALLFLVEGAKPETSWHFKTPDKKRLPPNAFLIAWSGRGQMPLRIVDGERFVTAWSEVAIPDDVLRIPGPEPEYSFIQSFRLSDLIKVFQRLPRMKNSGSATLRHPDHNVACPTRRLSIRRNLRCKTSGQQSASSSESLSCARTTATR